jgi:hypothetical protein
VVVVVVGMKLLNEFLEPVIDDDDDNELRSSD